MDGLQEHAAARSIPYPRAGEGAGRATAHDACFSSTGVSRSGIHFGTDIIELSPAYCLDTGRVSWFKVDRLGVLRDSTRATRWIRFPRSVKMAKLANAAARSHTNDTNPKPRDLIVKLLEGQLEGFDAAFVILLKEVGGQARYA